VCERLRDRAVEARLPQAAVAATGEQVTIGLLAIALHHLGVKARSYTGGQVRVLTDSAFTKARILKIDEERIRADLAESTVVIVAGFQGVDGDGNIIESYVCYLRRKLDRGEPRLIHTIRGIGYVMRIPPP